MATFVLCFGTFRNLGSECRDANRASVMTLPPPLSLLSVLLFCAFFFLFMVFWTLFLDPMLDSISKVAPLAAGFCPSRKDKDEDLTKPERKETRKPQLPAAELVYLTYRRLEWQSLVAEGMTNAKQVGPGDVFLCALV